ncbi:hypothetical protein WDU94_013884 [Cyamophila willieti]
MNLSLKQGIFPDIYKTAIITAIFKKGIRSDLQNYRPIAVLSNLGKILEKIVNTRLEEYIGQNNIIHDRQFGFRRGLGTEDALLQLTTYLHRQIDDSKKIIAVFLDVKKAYDSVDHTILLHELTKLGLDDTVLLWFKSYLKDRRQKLKLDDYISEPLTCHDYSIPQGSVLGPALFNIYINNLPKVSKGLVYCYADDACVCYTGDDWDTTFDTATQDLINIENWYSNMSLQLNLDKTNYMTFSITERGQPSPNKTLTIPTVHNQPKQLQKLTSVRYLGILLDQHLKWTNHVYNIKTKLRHLMYVFNNLRRVCSKSLLRVIYFAFVQSLLQYCISTWGGAYNNTIDPLRRTQNIILRIILHKDRLFNTKELYKLIDVFTINDLYFYKLTLSSIKYDNNWTINRNTYHTRQHGRTVVRRVNKTITQRHFYYLGQKLYDKIPTELKNLKQLPILLKTKTKEFIKNNKFDIKNLLPIN